MSSLDINVPELLNRYNIRPSKKLGQNFLISSKALSSVVNAAELNKNDMVLEIGPGLGNLTRYLASYANKVVAIEKDKKFQPVLLETIGDLENVEIIFDDALKVEYKKLFSTEYKVVANIPYYITAKLIRKILESTVKPSKIVLMVQKEVAQRICVKSNNFNKLALSIQVFGVPTVISNIPAKSFIPAPKVDSAIIKIDLYDQPLISIDSLDIYFDLLRSGFGQKRKKVINSISAGMNWDKSTTISILNDVGIDPTKRAQNLSLEEWGKLSNYVHGIK